MKTKIGVDELKTNIARAVKGDAGEAFPYLAMFFPTFFFRVFNLQCIFRRIKSGNISAEEAFDIVETLEVLGILGILKINLEKKRRSKDVGGARIYMDCPKEKIDIIEELKKQNLGIICGDFITPEVYINLVNRTMLILSIRGMMSIAGNVAGDIDTKKFNKLMFYFSGEGSSEIIGERFAKSVIKVKEERKNSC